MSKFEILAITPPSYLVREQLLRNNQTKLSMPAVSRIAIAAARAGYTGVIDLQFLDLSNSNVQHDLLQSLTDHGDLSGELGIRCSFEQLGSLSPLMATWQNLREKQNEFGVKAAQKKPIAIIVPDAEQRKDAFDSKSFAKDIARLKKNGLRVFLEIVSFAEAKAAQLMGIDGVIAKGSEAAGSVGEQTTFVLLQECLKNIRIPVLAEGGIGLHTAPACFAAGAHGVVLSSQLLLTTESDLPFELKLKIEQMDGTEPTVITLADGQLYRCYSRTNTLLHEPAERHPLSTVKAEMHKSGQNGNPLNWSFPLGQDVAFAGRLARKYISVAGIFDAVETAIEEHILLAQEHQPLSPNSSLAKSHGSEYPLVQGAMTRVSDTADFALKVAEGGGLPFLALALMRKEESDRLLSDSKAKLGNLPWGVGILGFVPTQLRQEQMEVIETYKPPYVLIAGGRPDQAKVLEEKGIKTYLHVPSPLLLTSFIEMGSRRFIFEGRECGGHVGPRSSFVLWEAMIEQLLESIGPRDDAGAYHILFAGGVHNDLSSCMVSVMAAPLAARGVKVGALMGTAYLFTEEAVSAGAIVKKFQEAAVDCRETVLLETGPGHAIRCIESPYKNTFDQKRQDLLTEGKGREEIREELELMNLGRLRIASKGLTRTSALSKEQIISEMASDKPTNGSELADLPEEQQWSEGMYMIGQIASMHNAVCTIKELHEQVSSAGAQLVKDLQVVRNLQSLSKVTAEFSKETAQQKEGIAIVGMSCLLPKAKDLDTYWRNILNKLDTIEEIPLEQWDWRNYYDADPQARDKIYSKWGGFLETVEFDPTKYGIPPASLNSIDPMQILLLEVTDSALKDAGYTYRSFPREKTSVILANAGHGPITALYSLRSMLGWKLADLSPEEKAKIEARLPEWTEDSFPGYLGNVTAGRVANRFDLGGVNFSIDAACASSLAALHTAVAELRSGASDVVLLSATDTHNQPGDYLSFSKTHAFSARGRCKTFDAGADGIVISEGMAMLVLKRLSDAERDGDRIYAVIKGIGGSSDGRDLSLTAPRPAGQVKALTRAYANANVDPATVTLVEAHGTGTIAGDKAEVEALKQVFVQSGARENSCAIGSVKTMIGHTKAAAGLASLIKVAKALHHKILPPTLGVKVPNPSCHFEDGPFYINSETRPWVLTSEENSIRRAGVSAFGFGGTNFHTVLEEYVPKANLNSAQQECLQPAELFVFHGRNQVELLKSVTVLGESIKRLSAEEKAANPALAILAYANYLKSLEWPNQRSGQKQEANSEISVDQCLTIVAISLSDLEEKIARAKADLIDASKSEIRDPRGIYFKLRKSQTTGKLAFVFPGQGSQQINMLSDLAMQFPELLTTFENANRVLHPYFDRPLTDFIYPSPSFTEEEELCKKKELTDTKVAQPAIGAASLAALQLLDTFDLKPDMVAGHSYGEYVALYTAGSLSFADLLKISAERGRILANANPESKGTMAAVSCLKNDLELILQDCPGVTIANINSPKQLVIAGSEEAIDKALVLLKNKGISAKRIPVSQAFHSPLMENAVNALTDALESVQFQPAKLPVYSNIDAAVYSDASSTYVHKLSQHIVKSVDFVSEIKKMHADGAEIFVEVGPGTVLTGLITSILEGSNAVAIPLDRSGRPGLVSLLHLLAQLISLGIKLDLRRLYSCRVQKLALAQNLESVFANKGTKSKKLTYAVNSVSIKRLEKGAVNASVAASTSQSKQLPSANKEVKTSVTNTNTTNNLSKDNAVSAHSQARPQVNTNGGKVITSSVTPPNAGQSGQSSIQRNTVNAVTPVSNPNMMKPQLPSARSRDQVMIEFQQTMLQMTNNFLQTQQNVMLAYLTGEQGHIVTPPENNISIAQVQTALPPVVNPTYPMPVAVASPLNRIAMPEPVQLSAIEYTGNGSNENSNKIVQTSPVVNSATIVSNAEESSNGAGQGQEADAEFLVNSLLDIVSQRTGYPTEMLEPGLDLEADLGIDSIKRVEILNSFRRILPESKQKQLESGIEQLAGTKTLQGIIDWLRTDPEQDASSVAVSTVSANGDGSNGNGKHHTEAGKLDLASFPNAVSIADQAPVKGNGNNGAHHESLPETGQLSETGKNIKRGLVKAVPLPNLSDVANSNGNGRQQAPEHTLVLITEDGFGATAAVAALCEKSGLYPVVLKHDRNADPNKFKLYSKDSKENRHLEFDLTDQVVLEKRLSEIQQVFGKPLSIIHLMSCGDNLLANGDLTTVSDSVVALFLLVKYLGNAVANVAHEHGAGIIAASAMGGKFALEDSALTTPMSSVQAAVAGLIKTIKKELPTVNCKIVDFEADLLRHPDSRSNLAYKLLAELDTQDSVVEIGYQKDKRFGIEVLGKDLGAQDKVAEIALTKDSTVLITGGARGITAEIAMELAQRYQPRIVLVGRSNLPTTNEDEGLARLTTAKEIKGKIIEDLKAKGAQVSVPVVEARYQALIREREMRDNLNKLTAAGAQVEYHALDVRDENAFAKLINSIYDKYSNIDAVIHGAGVIEDAYLKDKAPESFKRVFETKVCGALTLAKNLRLESLDYLILFSSVVGRTGNAGQGDYVSANEVMNKLASGLQDKVRGRVVSLMWGPWQGGMAQPELESIFANYGWAMINTSAGRQSFVEELSLGDMRDIEVLLVAELDKMTSLEPKGPKLHESKLRRLANGDYEFAFEVNTHSDVFLGDHTFDGVPVMPMAFALEFMGEAVASLYPDQSIIAIENMDIPAGIVFETNSKMIFVTAHEEGQSEEGVRVIASLSSGLSQRRVNFKTTFILSSNTVVKAPAKFATKLDIAKEIADLGEKMSVPPINEIYGTWLFHGPLFQGIKDIQAVSATGVLGTVVGSNEKDCLKNASTENWQLDPVMIDSAMQLAGVWARRHLDITVLPTGFKRVTKLLAKPNGERFTVKVFIAPESDISELTCDVAIYDEAENLFVLMQNLGGVGSKSLNRLSSSGIGIGAGR